MARAAKKAKMEPITVFFSQVKETKGAFQYAETDENGKVLSMKDDLAKMVVGSIYLRKSAVGEAPPKDVTVTIDFE